MMDENHPKRGHREYTKARATLLGVLVICVLIEILIVVIGGSIFVYCANKKAKQSEKIVKSYAENELQYYDTVEWFTSAQNIAQVLNISESKGDKILHHIREVYQEQFEHDLKEPRSARTMQCVSLCRSGSHIDFNCVNKCRNQ